MGAEREDETVSPASSEETIVESLTDLIDRMDREAFRRALEQRELRMLADHTRRVDGLRDR